MPINWCGQIQTSRNELAKFVKRMESRVLAIESAHLTTDDEKETEREFKRAKKARFAFKRT